MKAYVNQSHYYLYLDEGKGELPRLGEASYIAPLQQDGQGDDLGKRVMLALDRTIPFTEVYYTLPDAGWDELRDIRVMLCQSDYQRALSERWAIIRDGIFSFQIDVTDTSALI